MTKYIVVINEESLNDAYLTLTDRFGSEHFTVGKTISFRNEFQLHIEVHEESHWYVESILTNWLNEVLGTGPYPFGTLTHWAPAKETVDA